MSGEFILKGDFMRSLRVFLFGLMFLFAACVVVQTPAFAADNPTARKVTNVEYAGGAKVAAGASTTGWTWKKAAAVGAAVVIGGAVTWLTGGLFGAAAGLATYNALKPEECSFNDILNSFYSLNDGTWFGPVFNTLFNSINQLVVATNENLSGSVVLILSLLLAFYILFTVTKAVVSFSPIEPSKLISDIFFPVGRCIIAMWAIKNWQYIFSDMISPLLNLGITFGNEIIAKVQTTTAYKASLSSGVEYMTATCRVAGNAGLDKTVCDSIQTFLATVASNLLVWMAFGATMITDCWDKGWMGVLPSFKMFIMGLLLFIFTFMVYVSFPLKLIDALFRLMFVVVLFPLWCAFWVVPQTRKYFGKALEMFLNVLATFLSASVVLVMVISILGSLFDGLNMSKIIKLLQEGKGEAAMKEIDFSTSGLFYSICLLFMSFHLVSKVDYFANIFVKQDSLGIGGAVSKATTNVLAASPRAIGMAKNATKWGVGKTKQIAGGIANRSRAKSYNNNVPGGTARQGPRLWTANPVSAIKDRLQARKSLGGYARTGDVAVSKLQKATDGTTSQTYSNATYDKDKNLMARMKETTTSSGNKVDIGGKKVPEKQSVDRERTKFDEYGNISRTANVKKSFENGLAMRKTSTITNKNGNRVELSVDKAKGIASSIKYGVDNQKLSETVRDMKTGIKTVSQYKDGRVLAIQRFDRSGKLMP